MIILIIILTNIITAMCFFAIGAMKMKKFMENNLDELLDDASIIVKDLKDQLTIIKEKLDEQESKVLADRGQDIL